MSGTTIVMRHEFSKTTRRAGFVIMTLIIPVIAIIAIFTARLVSAAIAGRAPKTETVGFVDEAGGFARFTEQGNITLAHFPDMKTAAEALVKGDITQFIVIPADYRTAGVVHKFTRAKELIPPTALDSAIKSFLTRNLLDGKVDAGTLHLVDAPLAMDAVRLEADGSPAKDQGGFGGAIVPLLFSLLLALSIIFSSAYLLTGLGEEKENRLMEILISRVTPRELFTGKILGFGAAGLVQVVAWLASIPVMLWLASAAVPGVFSLLRVSPSFYILAFFYFVLGYLLLGVLNAGLGALGTTVRESQQLSALFNLIPVVPLWLMSLFLNFPRSPVWTVLSIFPLTAPVMVIERLGVSNIEAWEIAASLAVLALSAIGGIFVGSRLFENNLLTYGSRPRLGEILRSMGGK